MKTASLILLLSLTISPFIAVQAQTRRTATNHRQHASLTTAPQNIPASKRAPGQTQRFQQPDSEAKSATGLPIRRVILYSNGVAYVERRGMIRNHAEVSLSFKQSQVDDVLKSMIVIDLGKGRIGAVSYNSSEPVSTRMNEIPFSISAATDGNNSGGLAGVLSQLQGARVIVTTANRTVTGSVLTVEAQRSQVDANKPSLTTHRLVVASAGGALTAFDLSEVRSIQLADEGSRRDLSEFAHAAASARRRDAKTIVVTSDGNGERELMVSYTIAAPIWKTTYRVVLDSSGKPFFQGWAIVDNVSDEDWNGIELSLVSGTPVSFIQPIQNPVYRYRPVIPMRDDLNLRPQTYEPGEEGSGGNGALSGRVTDPAGGVIPNVKITLTNSATQQSFDLTANDEGVYRTSELPPGTYSLGASSVGFKAFRATNLNIKPGTRSKYNFNLDPGGISETVTVQADGLSSAQVSDLPIQGRSSLSLLALSSGISNNLNAPRRQSLANLVANQQSGVHAGTSANEIGDLFEYHIDQPVTVPRDRSALIPILQTRMEGERISIYRGNGDNDDESTPASRPLGGMLLKNTSALTLEDGSLTVVDGDAYAGEALLERLKPGEERLVSFALDLGTLINVRGADSERQPTFMVRALNGVVEAHYYQTRSKIYTLVNQTDRPRVVYIEHPRDNESDWELVAHGKSPGNASGASVSQLTTNSGAASNAQPDPGDAATQSGPAEFTTTANFYRFRVSLKPHEKLEFPVVERNEERDTYQLTNFTRTELAFFISQRYIDDQTRLALEGIIAIKEKVANADSRLQAIVKEISEITQDQQRLRDNIKALTSTAEARQLVMRYVAKADQQESRLDQLERERRSAQEELARLQTELNSAIRSLTMERHLN